MLFDCDGKMRGTSKSRTMSSNMNNNNNNNNHSNTITLPRGPHDMEEVAGATDTIYLCNFRVSVDGEWLCLKELQNLDIQDGNSGGSGGGGGGGGEEPGTVANFGTTIANNKCEEITKHERDWATYCRLLLWNFRFVCVVLVDNNCYYSSKFTPIFWGQASSIFDLFSKFVLTFS